jgi:DNA repair exonuclease SbcCD ATPase subunit
MIKDRRERVPLDHGRESKFSAKLMRLYADAVTAASRLVGGKGGTPTNASTALTAGERALIDKDHKEELTSLKMKYEAQIAKLKGMTGEQLQSLEEGAEKRVELIRVDYEAQIRKLKDSHEQRCAAMRENHQSNLNHVEQAAEEAHNALLERHAEEVNELRQMLNNQINQDRELSEALEKEIAHLQVAVQERRSETDVTMKHNVLLEDENADLRNLLDGVQQQHAKLQEMLTQQQQDIEASRTVRNQLIQTLMRQDEGDKTGAMMDKIEKLRRKIAQSLDSKQTTRLERERMRRNHGESRLERNRSEQNRKSNASRVERDREERRDSSPSRLERARGEEVDEKRSVFSRGLLDYASLPKDYTLSAKEGLTKKRGKYTISSSSCPV